MEIIIQSLPHLSAYQPALLAAALLCLMLPLQNFMTAPLSYVKEEQVPGMPLRGDHGSISFRAIRAFENSAENVPGFVLLTLFAALLGVGAGLVNGLSIGYLAARIAYGAVYYSGWGKPAGGPRTMIFVVCLLINVVLSALVIWALI